MRSAALALIAALAFAPAALAQEPPAPGGTPAPVPAPAKPDDKPAAPAAPAKPAKHENKVTEAARAYFDSMSKRAYNPVNLGLKDLKGTMEMNIQIPGMEDMEGMEGMPELKVVFAIDFKAPKTLNVEATTDNPMLANGVDSMKSQVKQLFLYGIGTMEPDAAAEFDADVVVEKSGEKGMEKETKVLVIKTYQQNELQGEMRTTTDANGLPGKSIVTATDPNSGMEMTIEMNFQFAKDGELYRLEKQTTSHPMLPEPMETAISYTDAGGFKVATAINSKGAMGMSFSFLYTDLTVNGKKVELPKAEKKAEEKKPEEKKPEEAKPEEAKPEAPKDSPK